MPPSIGNLNVLNDLSLFSNSISGSLPLELGSIAPLRYLRMQDNRRTHKHSTRAPSPPHFLTRPLISSLSRARAVDGNLTNFYTLGNLRQLITLDLYNNQMYGDVPAALQNLTSLQYLYLDNQHYKPLRQKYCRQRLPNNGKYNYRIVRDEYVQMTSVVCEDMHDTNFAFNSLQESGVFPS